MGKLGRTCFELLGVIFAALEDFTPVSELFACAAQLRHLLCGPEKLRYPDL